MPRLSDMLFTSKRLEKTFSHEITLDHVNILQQIYLNYRKAQLIIYKTSEQIFPGGISYKYDDLGALDT